MVRQLDEVKTKPFAREAAIVRIRPRQDFTNTRLVAGCFALRFYALSSILAIHSQEVISNMTKEAFRNSMKGTILKLVAFALAATAMFVVFADRSLARKGNGQGASAQITPTV